MYRFLFRTVYTARNSAAGVYECSVLPTKCNTAAGFRVVNGGGVKGISTCSVRFCEEKPDVVLSSHDEKTHADEEADPSEATQKAEDNIKAMKMAEQGEKPKTDDGSTTQQQMDVKIDQSAEKPKQVKTDAAKKGKQSLLELLASMKVDVSNKKLKIKREMSAPKLVQAVKKHTSSMSKKATQQASSQSATLDPELVAAASAAASTLPNCSQAESELLKQLRQHEAVTEAQKKGENNNLGMIIADMKVGKEVGRQKSLLTNQIRFDEDGQELTQDSGITAELDSVWRRKKFLRGKILNIFSPITDGDGVESAARPTLWDIEFANELSLIINPMPHSGFEEMIQWTKQGKIWQYPINNEAGLEEEANVPFHEHVFLEKHLNEGFPSEGPVRHFMELVVAGLSRNPYLTAQQKREHISWFRDYFHEKMDVLKEIDVCLN